MSSSAPDLLHMVFVEEEVIVTEDQANVNENGRNKVDKSVCASHMHKRKSPPRRRSSAGLTKQAAQSKRRQAALKKTIIQRELNRECGCPIRCQTKVSVYDVLRWRQKIHGLPQGDLRKAELMSIIRQCSQTLQKGKKAQRYKVEQSVVCRHFFIKTVLGISVASFARALDGVYGGKYSSTFPDKRCGPVQGTRAMVCAGFIKAYMESTCDRDPTGKYYRMPVAVKRHDLYSLYITVHKSDHLKRSAFYDVLKYNVPELCFNKTQRFTKCTECSDFRILIEKACDPEEKQELMDLRNLHLSQQQIEREAYYIRRGQAEMHPTKYFSVILDGMDQQKTDLPHYFGWNDTYDAGPRKLKTHIVGGIAHGRGKYFFLDVNEYPHDTNMTLTSLLYILQNEAKDGMLPPTLYVQLDNTPRENKNKYFLGMMAYLVKKEYVKEVYISFLIVGHTHEDVDQGFSKISQRLQTETVLTQTQMLQVVANSQDQKTYARRIGAVWDISQWLEPFINPVHNVMYPKIYRLFSDEAGHVGVQFKHFSTDDEWRPSVSEKPLEIFKLDVHSQQMIPEGIPDLVQPVFDEEEIDDLRRSLQKDFCLAEFGPTAIQEWEEFLENPERVQSGSSVWPLSVIGKATVVPSSSSLSPKEKDLIQKYKEKREQYKQVYTKQQLPNGQRGQHTDRRRYKAGDMVVFFVQDNRVSVGKVLSIDIGGNLRILTFTKQQQKFFPGKNEVEVQWEKCIPGGFDLTNVKKLPSRISAKIANDGLQLV